MDTMTTTKIVGGLCGSLLVFLLAAWVADIVYSTEGGHGDHAEAAYVIEVEEVVETTTGEAGPTFEELLAAADADKGKKVFSKCKACHKLEDGENSTGPSLFGIVGREIAQSAGFSFSAAMSGLTGTWSANALNAFLTKPTDFAPGTKMTFAGLKKAKDRANLIAYLQTVGN